VLDCIRAVQGEHVSRGDQRSDARDGTQNGNLRISIGQLLDAAIHLLDAGVERDDLKAQVFLRLLRHD
jgi:hypothetical protein